MYTYISTHIGICIQVFWKYIQKNKMRKKEIFYFHCMPFCEVNLLIVWEIYMKFKGD